MRTTFEYSRIALPTDREFAFDLDASLPLLVDPGSSGPRNERSSTPIGSHIILF